MSRDQILSRIRTSLGVKAVDAARQRIVDNRLADPPVHPAPARTRRTRDELVAQLIGFLEGQAVVVLRPADAAAAPRAIAAFLQSRGLALRLRCGADPLLARLPWAAAEPQIERVLGPAAPTDAVTISHALAGIAETGTLLLASGPENPVTLNFVPETHIVVLDEGDIVGSYEQAIARVRAVYGKGGMPRTLNYISGASRTADIGGKIVIGAHGPRTLCVVLLGSAPAA